MSDLRSLRTPRIKIMPTSSTTGMGFIAMFALYVEARRTGI